MSAVLTGAREPGRLSGPALLKIAIVKLSSLGDVIHALPVARALRRSRPGLHLTWIVEAREFALLNGHPDLDVVVPVDTRLWRRLIWRPAGARQVLGKVRRLKSRVRSARFDVALDLQGLMKSGLLTAYTGAPLRIGFTADRCRERLNCLFTNRRVRPPASAVHVVDQYLSLLAPQLAALEPRVCRLQMLRVRPATPFVLDHAVLTGLSCLHYGAFSDLPEAAALHAEVATREPALLEHGIHLLSSPTPDGDLIVGDSHDYGDDPSPFNAHAIDEILLGLAENTLGSALRVIERWQGVYGARTGTSGAPFSVLRAGPNVTGVYMHSGVGMSIGPALGERVVSHLLDGTALPTV